MRDYMQIHLRDHTKNHMQNHARICMAPARCIALLLCACLLCGCTAGTAPGVQDAALSESVPMPQSGSETQAADSTEEIAAAGTPGGYVEFCASDLLPEAYRSLYDLHIETDGAVSVTGVDQTGTLRLLRYQNGEWQTEASLSPEEQDIRSPRQLSIISEDGALWYTEHSETEGSALFRLEKGNEAQQIPVPCLERVGSIPVLLHSNADGTLFLSVQYGEQITLAVIQTDTCAVREIHPGFYAKPAFYEAGQVYGMVVGSTVLYTWDAQTGEEQDHMQLSVREDVSDFPCSLGNGMFSYADERGLHTTALGGSIRQDLAQNRSFAIARESFTKSELTVGPDEIYWVTGWENGTAKLYGYFYDPSLVQKPVQTLTIWTMEDCLLLREAVSTFLAENQDVEIEIEYGEDSLESGLTEEDIIRALNVRIAAGDGPDVLILDGLPVDAYIAQGLLENLDGQIDLTGCYENIVNCYRTGDSLCAVPMLFRPALIYCRYESEAEILRSAQSLSDLRPILCDHSKYFFGGYYNVFSELYPAASADIFPQGGTGADEAALREFLTLTKDIVTMQGIAAETDALFGRGEDTVVAMGMGKLGLDTPASMPRYGREESACAGGMPSDYFMTYIDAVVPFSALPAAIRPMPGNVFEPILTVGVPTTSSQKELAIRWAQCMLDCENDSLCRYGASFNGYFIKAGIQQNCPSRTREGVPTPSELDLDGLCRQLRVMAVSDTFLRNAVYEEAQKLYQGKQDVESTVRAIVTRIRLYEAERQ